MSRRGKSSVVAVMFRKELVEIMRDRRAVFFAFVLPLLLHPVFFWLGAKLPEMQQQDLKTRDFVVSVSGDISLLAEHLEPDDHIELVAKSFDDDEARDQALRDDAFKAHVTVTAAPSDDDPVALGLRYRGSSASSNEVSRRLAKVFERWEKSAVEKRFADSGVTIDTATIVSIEARDVASDMERKATGLSRFLPALLVLLLLTGGTFAALDSVAGEKERGTFETLAIQAVTTRQITWAKFYVTFLTSTAAVLLNLVGLVIALSLGLAPKSFGEIQGFHLSWGQGLTIVALLLPLSVLSSSALLALSAYSRSFREAQTYLFPLTLALLPAIALAAMPNVRLSGVLALVPVTNVCLAIRESLTGEIEILPLVLVLLTTAGYAYWSLRWVASILEREDILLGLEPPPMARDAGEEARGRRAIRFGVLSLVLVYFAGSWLQGSGTFSFEVGLALTLWVVVLVPGLGYDLAFRKDGRSMIGLSYTGIVPLLMALPAAFSLAAFNQVYQSFQDSFLPVPESFMEQMEAMLGGVAEQHWSTVFFLLALSPGITEEVMWRGAFFSDLVARGKVLKAILITGFFFGAFHLSIYRFVPTAIAGVALATVRWRSKSILPCMVFHTAYNATAIFALEYLLADAMENWAIPIGLVAAVSTAFFVWTTGLTSKSRA